jgi:hypothetical protein
MWILRFGEDDGRKGRGKKQKRVLRLASLLGRTRRGTSEGSGFAW